MAPSEGLRAFVVHPAHGPIELKFFLVAQQPLEHAAADAATPEVRVNDHLDVIQPRLFRLNLDYERTSAHSIPIFRDPGPMLQAPSLPAVEANEVFVGRAVGKVRKRGRDNIDDLDGVSPLLRPHLNCHPPG